MSVVATIARKELRAYFASPVALIFLAAFLIACMFGFFGTAGFFARNLADVRPLFAWMPLLLILLVAAITMRQWSEEKKMGTLEVLLTLPVPVREMVVGKFLAGLVLVVIALALTFPVPVMVSRLGDLDWGPVIGGYVGAILLAAAYLAIGLCISARTDNQVVALMSTLVCAGVLYLIGSERFTTFFETGTAELLRGLGSGSRFESIERGVLDLRDLVYYAGLATFFLTLNWSFLEAERIDPGCDAGRGRSRALRVVVALLGANLLALNVWLAPITSLRLDMTERGEYSIDRVTIDTLDALAEPIAITGYFSERTHPLLAPLVVQIRDLLAEYDVHGGESVGVEFIDPNADEAVEEEIAELYGIRSVPFRVADRHQQAVVNSFFHLLIRQGDQFETLSFEDLIDVHASESSLDVRLRNLEYDLTRTIKRVSQEFQSMEKVFEQLPGEAVLTLYLTPSTLPADFEALPERIRIVADELVESSGGKLSVEISDPSADPALAERLAEELGIRPLAVDLFGRETFYLDLVFEVGDQRQRIMPRSDLSEADLRASLEAAVRRATPGQLKTVGLYTGTPAAPPPHPQLPPQYQPPPPQPDYRFLGSVLREEFGFESLDLEAGHVPDHVDVLLVGKLGEITPKQQFAIDQFLMRGGKLIALAGRHQISASREGLRAEASSSPFFEMLSGYGVEVGDGLVMDAQNAPFPIPVQEQVGGMRLQRIELLPYPFFVDVRRDGMDVGNPSFSGVQNLTGPWSSPLRAKPPEGVEVEDLLASSSESWLNESGNIEPDLKRYPGRGFGPAGELTASTLAMALGGSFPSHFAERPSPLFATDDAGVDAEGASPDATGRTLKRSLPDARLVVLGSSEFASDLILQLSQQPGGEVHRGNLQWILNLVDWLVADTDLLRIRSTGAFARTLRPLAEGEARRFEFGTYLAVLIGLGLVTFTAQQLLDRRSRTITGSGEDER